MARLSVSAKTNKKKKHESTPEVPGLRSDEERIEAQVAMALLDRNRRALAGLSRWMNRLA